MIPVSPELADAIEAPERHPLVRLAVTWDANDPTELDDLSGYVESLTIDRSLAGDLPEEVSLVEGAAAASADATLAGTSPTGGTLASAFHRANTASPLHGKELLSAPITADIGFATATGPQWVRRFTGVTRAVRGASGSRTVRLKALDLREHLSWPVTLPILERAKMGLNASWVIDEVIRWAGGPQRDWYVSPFSPEASFAAPMHGSLYPPGGPPSTSYLTYTARMFASQFGYPSTTGTTFTDTTVSPAFLPGPFLSGVYAGAMPNGRKGAMVRGELGWDLTSGSSDYTLGRFECWTIRRGSLFGEGTTAWRVAAVLTAFSGTSGILAGVNGLGQIVLAKHSGNPDAPTVLATGPTVPADGGWHYVGIGWDASAGGGNATITLRLDAATTTASTAAFPTSGPSSVKTSRVYFRQPVAEVTLTDSILDPQNSVWLWDARDTVNAVIDLSTLELDLIPDAGPRPGWEWLREIAAAEQAVIFIDEQGILRYRTAARLSAPDAQTAVRTVTATDSILDLAFDDAIDSVRNQVTVTAQTFAVAENLSQVYTSADVWSVEPGGTRWWWIDLTRPAVGLDLTPVINRPSDPAPAAGGTFVCLSFNPDGTATGDPVDEAKLAAVGVSAAYDYGDTYHVRVQNTTGRTLYVATAKSATPCVSLAGRAITSTPVEADRAPYWAAGTHPSVRRHGLLPLKLSANQWVQRTEVADALAYRLLYDLYLPVAVVRDLSIVGDPRLQLGDRIRVRDRDGLALDGDYWISAIRETYSSQGYTQSITARRASTTLRWGVGKWGENTWGEF